MDIKLIVKVTSRAWSLDILALLHEGAQGRQAPLLAATGASRTAFVQSLAHLTELKLLERNPGHGHPLRPEYRLTMTGKGAAKVAHNIMHSLPAETEMAILRRTWIVPVLSVLKKPRRFGDIKSDLSPITDRALSKSLGQLEDKNWLLRDVDVTDRPLRPTYQAINTGAKICRAADT